MDRGIFLVFFAVLGCAVTEPVHAYLDPATGSIILQGIIAAVAGAAVTAKVYWAQIKGFFNRSKDDAGLPDDEEPKVRERQGNGDD